MAETATTGSDLWQLILDLHGARNLAPIKDMPDGVWKQALPGGWFMAVNGGDKVQIVAPEGGMAVPVERFEVAFWFNGWLAGTVSPFGGTLAAGQAANIDTLAEALRMAIAERAESDMASAKDVVNTWLRENGRDGAQVGSHGDIREAIDALVFAVQARNQRPV